MFNWHGKKVFISGGAGVIGTILVRQLYQLGADIFVGDLKFRPTDLPKSVRYRQGDLNFIAKDELEAFNPEVFFHLAATFERSTETYGFWEENFQHNVALSHHLMTCLKDVASLKRVVFASSYLIYDPKLYLFDQPQEQPVALQETDSIYPRNLCGVAKLQHEIELRFLQEFHATTCSFVSPRIFRGYGKGSHDVISRWIRQLLRGEEIRVYCPEGMFDYIYADDTAQGLINIAASSVQGVVNLGNGHARRVADIVEILKRYFPLMRIAYDTSAIAYEASQADIDLLQKAVGWIPEKQLEDAIPEIIAFENQQQVTVIPAVLEPRITILVTSISRKVGLIKSLRQALSKLGTIGTIIGGDSDIGCLSRYFIDDFWQMPRLADLSIHDLLIFCKQKQITHIVPTRDGELSFWAQHKKFLQQHGIAVMVSDEKITQACLDKLLFYQILHDHNIPAIQTTTNIDELSCQEFVVKERFGAGSLGIKLKIDKQHALESSRSLQQPIFQPFIKGQEYSIDMYVDAHKQVKGIVTRKRLKVERGESQVTSVYHHEKLKSVCKNVAEYIPVYGHIVLQALVDDDDNISLIECNPRFGGASTLSVAAGLDSFYWFLLEGMGVDIDEYVFIPAKKLLTQVRFPQDLIIDGNSF